ncbi:hypothetical protein GQ607_010642, partial [Colletotrichum asianum]
ENFNAAATEAVYIELWNTKAAQPSAPGSLKGRWENLKGGSDKEDPPKHNAWLENEVLSRFSWLRDEETLPDLPDLGGEQRGLETNEIVDGVSTISHDTTHNVCSLLVRKAKAQKSFKLFQDLSRELFDSETIESIADFFGMAKYYNDFRKLDFGCCEIREAGEGGGPDTLYVIQTPYYSSGFWSMFLVGRADPKSPGQARKLSGLIQSGADVKLGEILSGVVRKADEFCHHPLLLPFHLYVNHYEGTSAHFKAVLDIVEHVEGRIMKALHGKRRLTSQVAQRNDDHDDQGTNHWDLASFSKDLHEASMKVAELARRRNFEDDLAKLLKKELEKRVSDQNQKAQNQLLGDLTRYDRWANAHQSDIDGMPGRIDSLNTLLYSMIAQQDNIVSIKLAKEGLSDSKAMKTLSVITILFLPGTFVATLFTTNVVSFESPAAETTAYIKITVPLTVVLMILYGLWLWKEPEWSRMRRKMRDPEACLGSLGNMFKNSSAGGKKGKQS